MRQYNQSMTGFVKDMTYKRTMREKQREYNMFPSQIFDKRLCFNENRLMHCNNSMFSQSLQHITQSAISQHESFKLLQCQSIRRMYKENLGK